MVSLWSIRIAHAACPSGSDRYLVSQPPDIIFSAGVPSVQYVPVVFVNYPADGADCGTFAVTTIPGITMVGNYCNWSPEGGCDIGQSVKIDSDSGGSEMFQYRYFLQDHLRRVEVRYDGSTPAGTVGTIDLFKAGEF